MSITSSIPIVRPDDTRSTPVVSGHPGDLLTRRQRLVYVLVLGALTALGPFTVDLYLPAFPVMQDELGVSATAVQLTLTGTMIGFGLGQLIVGPWSDKVGRRLPLILATTLHIAASSRRPSLPTSCGSACSACCRVSVPPRAVSWPWRWCATCSAASRSCACCRVWRSSTASRRCSPR